MVFISGEWLTTVEAAIQHEQEICESKMKKPLASSSVTKGRSETKRAKAVADATKALMEAGI